ncbi:MAG: GNAT family N-acetyltransferase [Chloroflexota bacterium]
MTVLIRKPTQADFGAWKTLFAAYIKFYRASIPDEIMSKTWARIHDEQENINGLVAEVDGQLVGLTHFLYHDSTWSDRKSCYLQDLFVAKSARGSGIARQLIIGVEAEAEAYNAFNLYLLTQQYNSAARSLYDSMLGATPFVVYRKKLP